MNKIIPMVLFTSLIVACSKTDIKNMNTKSSESIEYPETRKGSVSDTYFETPVADPYRWLEDDMSAETAEWVKAQNKVTHAYLDKIPYRSKINDMLTRLWNYEKVSAPFKEGNYTYYYRNDGLQNQSVLYRRNSTGGEEVFLDPNTFSQDGTVSLSNIRFSRDGSIAAYAISEGGSDWRKVKVIDVESKQQIEETLVDIKFSDIAWYKNEGFYYSSYDKPEGSELSAKTDQHKVYYHQLGTSQSEDQVIFGATPEQKHRYVGAEVSEDDQFLIISAAIATSGNKLFIRNLNDNNSSLVTVLDHADSNTYYLTNKGRELYFVTDLDAPNQRIVSFDATNPSVNNWKDVIAETENVLSATTGSGYIFARYMVDAISQVKQFDLDGNMIREIQLPGIGTASGFDGKKDSKELYYSFTNYFTPSSVFRFNPEDGDSGLYSQPKIDFNPDNYISEQVFYNSKDGTRVPMIITYKKGIKMNGSNPTILYGYGGFNISMKPAFSIVNAVWMELGGVYAVANLRGGGEYGAKWHDAGTQMHKQNVFDDFIAAAGYLIGNNYTSSDYLAIRGGSNGGLLVGAVMTQRPDLMKVALPAVGVLDMLRYHTFTAGAGWAYDYGTSEQSKEMFEYLLGYSPVHNVRQGVDYPATLVTTGDHDDRVVPAHSFKFAAELQAKGSDKNPLLIRIETDAGHGAGTPVSKTIEQYSDIFAFTLWNMGVKDI